MVGVSLIAGVLAATIYLATVRLLRYRRVDEIKRKYGMLDRANSRHLTADQAQDILKELVEMEFPKFMGFSIVFALFKSYGIPSISSLLIDTGQLATAETASKRIADTGVLLLEFCMNKPSSDRAMRAIARMNFLHGRYIKAGKIANDDLLYTLSIFALEPARWINEFEWRQLSDLELCAMGTFWKATGDRMHIDYSPLAHCSWKDGLDWLHDVREWSETYERRHMVPSESNRQLALAHLDILFFNLSKGMKQDAMHVVSVLVGNRLRQAMMLPQPPYLHRFMVENALLIRRLVLRHLTLPRPQFRRKSYISARPEPNGRYSAREYLSDPWYVKPTPQRRWGLKAWRTRLLGRKLPGDGGDRYMPQGYSVASIGPAPLVHIGQNEMLEDMSIMRVSSAGGCPFSSFKEE